MSTLSDVKIEVFTRQSEIIRLQAEIIDELFRLLTQHLTAIELDKLPVIEKINDVARIREENNL